MAKQALSQKRKYWLIGLSLSALLVLAFIISVPVNQPESTPTRFEYLDILAHPENTGGSAISAFGATSSSKKIRPGSTPPNTLPWLSLWPCWVS